MINLRRTWIRWVCAGLVGVVVIVGALAWYASQYVPYVPITIAPLNTRKGYESRPDLASEIHVAAVRDILREYGYSYKDDGGVLKIPRWLSRDKDMISNITSKAELRRSQGVGIR